MSRATRLVTTILLALLVTTSVLADELGRREKKERIASLDPQYRQFLLDVEPIIHEIELQTFLRLESNLQRERYIEDFWSRRDPSGRSPDNPYRADYYARLEEADAKFRHRLSDQFRVFMTQGRPVDVIEPNCGHLLIPIEIWAMRIAGRNATTLLLFYSPAGRVGDYRLFHAVGRNPEEELLTGHARMTSSVEEIFYRADRTGRTPLDYDCRQPDAIRQAIDDAKGGVANPAVVFAPPPVNPEEVRRFLGRTVMRNPDAPEIPTELSIDFPATRDEKTDVRVTILADRASLSRTVTAGIETFTLDVDGEVLRDELLYETFSYRFDLPAGGDGAKIPVTLDRFLREGTYQLRLRLRDRTGGGEAVVEVPLEVPPVSVVKGKPGSNTPPDDGRARVRILPLPDETITGFRSIEVAVAGDGIRGVEFYLDGEKVMTKRRPPYSLELDFGEVPRPRRVRVLGVDVKGNTLDGDEIVVNEGMDRLRVRITSPRFAQGLQGTVRVEMEANVPAGDTLDVVELWLNELRVAELKDGPFVQSVQIPDSSEIGYLRAVVRTTNGAEAEDLVLVNAPGELAEVTVHLVEVPVSVHRDGVPLTTLAAADFSLLDRGSPVEITRFELMRDRPLSIGLAIDTSNSMDRKIEPARTAAASFFSQVLRSDDRAFIVGFDERPRMVRRWTSDPAELTKGLGALRTEESTALWDAIVFALYNFRGIDGQKALLLLSDGRDTSSSFGYEQALEFARRSGIPIYAMGVGISAIDVDTRRKLSRLASETGGRWWDLPAADGLVSIYSQIEVDLRSQYLLGFYPTAEARKSGAWRSIEVKVPNADVRARAGYYP